MTSYAYSIYPISVLYQKLGCQRHWICMATNYFNFYFFFISATLGFTSSLQQHHEHHIFHFLITHLIHCFANADVDRITNLKWEHDDTKHAWRNPPPKKTPTFSSFRKLLLTPLNDFIMLIQVASNYCIAQRKDYTYHQMVVLH